MEVLPPHPLSKGGPQSRWQALKQQRACGKALKVRLHPGPRQRLPVHLRAQNVSKLATTFPLGVRDVEFARIIQRIDTGPIHEGNEIEVYFDGEQAFAAVHRAIMEATSEILLETYILRDDDVGRSLMLLLGDAAQRGVRVRVLADAYGSWWTKKAFWREMQGRGIEARFFHPFANHFRGILFRDHRKIIVVDRKISFTGGMNMANEYGSSRHSQNVNWRDTHMRIVGPTSFEMALVFGENWERSGGASLLLPQATPVAPLASESARTLVLDARAGRGHREMAAILAVIAGAARQRLWITNAYFAPNRTTIQLLCDAARRGVDVCLLLQGPTDIPMVQRAGRGNYKDLLSSGVRIYEYQAAVLHAKTLVVDDCVSMIGSSNLDFRSFYFNAECNVLVIDDAIAGQMAVAFEADLTRANEIHLSLWSQRSCAQKLTQRLARFLSPLM